MTSRCQWKPKEAHGLQERTVLSDRVPSRTVRVQATSWLAAPVALAQPQRDACSRACAAAQYGPARCGANLGQRNETDEPFEATSSGRFSLSITCV